MMGFIMLRLARVVLGNNILISVSVRFLNSTFESFLGFWEFFPRLSATFLSGAGTWSKITSPCLRSLIGQLSFLLVPNMVLSKMNNHEHRTKQTCESYVFQGQGAQILCWLNNPPYFLSQSKSANLLQHTWKDTWPKWLWKMYCHCRCVQYLNFSVNIIFPSFSKHRNCVGKMPVLSKYSLFCVENGHDTNRYFSWL